MKYTKEQRQDFEDWVNYDFYGGLVDISDEWDEERNCYKNYAHHIAFHGWLAGNNSLKDETSAEAQVNCAEEILDSYAAHLNLKETSFDCIGDYITAVCEALKAKQ